MDEQYILDTGPAAGVQPGVLECGIFLTFSEVRTSGWKHVWIRRVRRTGVTVFPRKWKWNTAAMPEDIYEEICDTVRAMLDEEVIWRYGIQKRLPD